MPYTTLVYAMAMISNGQIENGWFVALIVSVLIDFSVLEENRRKL